MNPNITLSNNIQLAETAQLLEKFFKRLNILITDQTFEAYNTGKYKRKGTLEYSDDYYLFFEPSNKKYNIYFSPFKIGWLIIRELDRDAMSRLVIRIYGKKLVPSFEKIANLLGIEFEIPVIHLDLSENNVYPLSNPRAYSDSKSWKQIEQILSKQIKQWESDLTAKTETRTM